MAARLHMQVERVNLRDGLVAGGVSNTRGTCLREWDTVWKRTFHTHNAARPMTLLPKIYRSEMASAPD